MLYRTIKLISNRISFEIKMLICGIVLGFEPIWFGPAIIVRRLRVMSLYQAHKAMLINARSPSSRRDSRPPLVSQLTPSAQNG
jgi:hypothetical protein